MSLQPTELTWNRHLSLSRLAVNLSECPEKFEMYSTYVLSGIVTLISNAILSACALDVLRYVDTEARS